MWSRLLRNIVAQQFRLRILGHFIVDWDVLLKCKPASLIRFIVTSDRFDQDRVFKDRT